MFLLSFSIGRGSSTFIDRSNRHTLVEIYFQRAGMAIEITPASGPGEESGDEYDLNEQALWETLSSSMKRVSDESTKVKMIIDPRVSPNEKIAALEALETPLQFNLKKIALHGLCSADAEVRSAVVELFGGLEEEDYAELKPTLASLALGDNLSARRAVGEIVQLRQEGSESLALEAERYQLSVFTDPRTCDQERVRVARRLKNASVETLRLLAPHGLESSSPKVRDAVAAVLKSAPEKIVPMPLEKLSELQRFIDPRTSEEEKLRLIHSSYSLSNDEANRMYLHGFFEKSPSVHRAVYRLFVDAERIRDDDLRVLLMDLCLHEDRGIRRAANSIMTPENFMLGDATRQIELVGVQVDAFIDPRTCLEHKLKIAGRLKGVVVPSVSEFVIHGLHSESARLRDRVVKTLLAVKRVERADVWAVVRELTESEIPHVRESAKKALGQA